MKNFSYQDDLEKLSKSQELVEVYFRGASTFGVAYILNVNEDFVTFAIINSNDLYGGVVITRKENIRSLSTSTAYLKALSLQLNTKSLYQEAMNDVKVIQNFTFNDILSTLNGKDFLVEVGFDDDDKVIGKVTGFDENILAIDEFSETRKERVAHTYFSVSDIVALAFGTPSIVRVSQSFSN